MDSKNPKGREKLIRICVLGSSFVGKSTLCNRFVNNSFEWVYEPTCKTNFFRRLINITDDDEHIQYCMMQIEDLFPINHPSLQLENDESALEMRTFFEQVIDNTRSNNKKPNEKALFKETAIQGYMYVYDLTSKASLEEVTKVIEYIHTREEKEAGKKKSGKAAKILVGTKSDCLLYGQPDQQSKVDALKKKFGLNSRKVSALKNEEIKEAFLDLARSALESKADGNKGDAESDEESEGFFSFLGCGGREKAGSEGGGCSVT